MIIVILKWCHCNKTMEEYLRSCQASMMEPFCENSLRILGINYFCKIAQSQFFNWVLNTTMSPEWDFLWAFISFKIFGSWQVKMGLQISHVYSQKVNLRWELILELLTEATLHKCSYEKVFWKYEGNLQESIHCFCNTRAAPRGCS